MCTKKLGWYVRDYKPFALNLFPLLPGTQLDFFSVSFGVRMAMWFPAPLACNIPHIPASLPVKSWAGGREGPVTEFSQQKVRKEWLPLAGLVFQCLLSFSFPVLTEDR